MPDKKRQRMNEDEEGDGDIVFENATPTTVHGEITATQWQKTIESAIPAIVSIRFSQVAAFDTESAETSEATGFVVDKTRGLILTNRHGEAIFHDHEEVDVYPVVMHDFGFLKFDPSKIRYMPVTEIALAPHLAKVGLDIRVVGNDAGEKLSILAGSISRLDRNAPIYGDLTYNDFNTFYLQAASSTSGGSSGSPVLEVNGNAVALQAGGHTKAATDFFFPLDRVARALSFLQRGLPVPRGTIQTQFYYRPFDEVRRLGLRESTEEMVRKWSPNEIGMLVAETVVPNGPAFGFLEEGDVLVSVNDKIVSKFVALEEEIDYSVGCKVKLHVERGGQPIIFEIEVHDLHSITPDRYVMIGGAKVNNLSYQLARTFCVPVSGVYVADPAGMFRLDGVDQGWIIDSIDNFPTPNIDAFIEAIRRLHDRDRVPVTYYSIVDVHTKNVAIVVIDRHWTSFRMAIRNDVTGIWDFTDLGEPLPPKTLEPLTASFAELDESLGAAKTLFQSVVKVSYYMPCRLDGYPKSRKHGAGIVLDSQKGLIVVGRNIVPFNMGDVSITFADSIIVPGKLHRVSPRPVCIESTVTDITTVTIPQCSTPRFRSFNFDAITLDTPLAQQCSSGVLADANGMVQGLWLSFLGERTSGGQDNEYYLGVSARILEPILKRLRCGEIPKLRGLTVELMPVHMAQARHMGLTDALVKAVEEANPNRRQLFMVRTMEAGSSTASALKELDLIVSINGKLITKIHEFDVSEDWGQSVEMMILRGKKILNLQTPTESLNGEGTNRILIWAGALIQEPHRAVLQQSRTLPCKVYVSARTKGSPSYMYGLMPTTWISHVNDKETNTLDEFLAAVKDLPDNTVREKVSRITPANPALGAGVQPGRKDLVYKGGFL
ncbi:hypothetical protein HDU97_008775 [Phlyctochytrium planicorne]|nr:hypothetical protein HDU97_008775 [Phlyctochytrium planicorne]